MIEQKTDTLPMGEYYVTYKEKEKQGVHVYYTIEYFRLNPKTGLKEKSFELKPFIQLNERMGNVAEPATEHFLTKDIYTHITYAELDNNAKENAGDEYQAPKTQQLAIGDTFVTSNSFVILEGLNKDLDREKYHLHPTDLAVAAQLRIEDINRKNYRSEPIFLIRDLMIYTQDSYLDELGLKFTFNKIDPSTGKIDLSVSEKKENKRDFVIMKAIIFPGINILWLGCILMIIGSLMAVRKMLRKNRRNNSAENTAS